MEPLEHLAEARLQSFYAVPESPVVVEAVQAFRRLRLQVSLNSALLLPATTDRQAERPTMDRERAHSVQGQPMPIEQCVERRHGEVAQVLVVNRVELEAIDQLAHVRHLDLGDPVASQDGRNALDE